MGTEYVNFYIFKKKELKTLPLYPVTRFVNKILVVTKVFFRVYSTSEKKNLYKSKTKSKCYRHSAINKKKDSRKFLNRNYLSKINYIER